MPRLKVAMVANDLLPTPDWVVPQLAEQGIALVERECTRRFRSCRNGRRRRRRLADGRVSGDHAGGARAIAEVPRDPAHRHRHRQCPG